MQRIYPVTEKTCRDLCGKPVLMFLSDGTELQGMLSRVDDGRLILNEPNDIAGTRDTSVKAKKKVKTKAKATKKISGRKATLAANGEAAADPFLQEYPPLGYGFGAPLAFDINTVAALFVLA